MSLPLDTTDRAPFNDGGSSPQIVVRSPSGGQTVWWILTILLAVIATTLIMRLDEGRLTNSVYAQAGSEQLGARGIYAFTGQLTGKSYGLFMMDVDRSTVWCYEFQRGPHGQPQMKLVAARSWFWDRFLEEFNVAEPVPGDVRLMVEQQKSHNQDITGTMK
ncbi:MAG: hypothetical protein ACYTF1_21110 [Planctomycetota bacterium]